MRWHRAKSPQDFALLRALIKEYAAGLGIDLGFQDLAAELGSLESMYGSPTGVALILDEEDEACGCVCVRALDPDICEMKRLYVRAECRGRGHGRALARAAVHEGARLGYSRMRLDTLESMAEAMTLYRDLGFVEIAPYRNNPHPARYFEKVLEREGPSR